VRPVSAVGDRRAPLAAVSGAQRRATSTVGVWVPVCLWAALIMSLSGDQFSGASTAAWLSMLPLVRSLSPAGLETVNLIVRKCAHFVEYAVLGLLIARATLRTWPRRGALQVVLLAVALAALWASVDELHQRFWASRRTGQPADAVLDTVSASAGAAAAASVLTRRSAPRPT
jgi:VanZ family protein